MHPSQGEGSTARGRETRQLLTGCRHLSRNQNVNAAAPKRVLFKIIIKKNTAQTDSSVDLFMSKHTLGLYPELLTKDLSFFKDSSRDKRNEKRVFMVYPTRQINM